MQAEDRTIHFSVELIHPVIKHRKEDLQKLYFDLSQTRNASYDSTDFSNPIQTRFYSRRGKKSQSIALFLPDRVVLIEEWTDIPLSVFLEKVREVASRTLSQLRIPKFVVHTATIRSTFALTHFDDARIFLLDHACAQKNRITPHFQRPIAVGGLRFVLPETPQHPGSLTVLIESFKQSVHEVFVEAKGVFASAPVGTEELETLLEAYQGSACVHH